MGLMSVTHVAGPVVRFNKLDRLIQRCAICGYKLEDLIPSCVLVASINGNDELPSFEECHLIRVTEGNPKHFEDLGNFVTATLPDDFCLPLVER